MSFVSITFMYLQPIPGGMTFSKALSRLKAQSSNISFATFQWKETFELWALSFETAFENVIPLGIGCRRVNELSLIAVDVWMRLYTCEWDCRRVNEFRLIAVDVWMSFAWLRFMECRHTCMYMSFSYMYGVATISRLLNIKGLFCTILSLL